jgi:hypothetical protein
MNFTGLLPNANVTRMYLDRHTAPIAEQLPSTALLIRETSRVYA